MEINRIENRPGRGWREGKKNEWIRENVQTKRWNKSRQRNRSQSITLPASWSVYPFLLFWWCHVLLERESHFVIPSLPSLEVREQEKGLVQSFCLNSLSLYFLVLLAVVSSTFLSFLHALFLTFLFDFAFLSYEVSFISLAFSWDRSVLALIFLVQTSGWSCFLVLVSCYASRRRSNHPHRHFVSFQKIEVSFPHFSLHLPCPSSLLLFLFVDSNFLNFVFLTHFWFRWKNLWKDTKNDKRKRSKSERKNCCLLQSSFEDSIEMRQHNNHVNWKSISRVKDESNVTVMNRWWIEQVSSEVHVERIGRKDSGETVLWSCNHFHPLLNSFLFRLTSSFLLFAYPVLLLFFVAGVLVLVLLRHFLYSLFLCRKADVGWKDEKEFLFLYLVQQLL